MKQAIVPRMGPISVIAGKAHRNVMPVGIKLLIGWKI